MRFITRAYNNISLQGHSQTLIKTSAEERIKNEIEYYINLPTELEIYFPRIISHNIEHSPYSMELEFYAYRNVGQFYLSEIDYKKEFWNDFFVCLFSIIKKFKQHESNFNEKQIKSFCHSMFVDKTLTEYTKLKKDFPGFEKLCSSENITLNNVEYGNFEAIWDDIKSRLDEIIAKQQSMNVIHGDMCFSNILIGYSEQIDNIVVKLLDPRGAFGVKGIYGSSLYDYAKLLHSIDGNYESFIYDKFSITKEFDKHYLEVLNNKVNEDSCLECFTDRISREEYQDAKIIQGLIFIGMCARHYDSIERQKAMYLTGIRILNEVLNEDLR